MSSSGHSKAPDPSTPSPESPATAATAEKAVPHMLTTKSGTERSVFEDYVKTLPDQGKGHRIAYEHLPWQSYVTSLTTEQARQIRQQSFIESVGPVTED